jgi:hypothetical protein
MKPLNRINIIVGDKYNDGHGMHGSFPITTNLTITEMEESYNATKKITNICIKDLFNDYCNLENSNVIYSELCSFFEGMEEQNNFYFSPYEYFRMYLRYVEKSRSDFVYSIVDEKEIDIGGYALYE